MNIIPISESEYESINGYLDVMSTKDLRDLSMVDFNNKRYVIRFNGITIYMVENNNGELNPMEINLDESGDFRSYITEQFSYDFSTDKENIFIQKKERLSNDTRYLYFIKNSDLSSVLEYQQYIASNFASLKVRYEMTEQSSNPYSALCFSNYHFPTTMEIHEPKKHSLSHKENIYNYYLEDEENYRRSYFVRNDKHLLCSFLKYPGNELMEMYENALGFTRGIDDDLKSYILGNNKEINEKKLLVRGYLDYQKGQKHI